MTTDLRLRPPHHRVDRRAIILWTLHSLLVAVPAVAAPAIAAALVEELAAWLWLGTAALAAPAVAVTLAMPRWRYRVHRWETTVDAVYTSSGWLWQEWRVAPMSRIQTVDTERGPLQRLLGLSTVTVTTASAAGSLRIVGLDRTRAAELARYLTQTTQATPGDAT
ncbi:hypothetical protein HNR23_001558 [Nocardiopsis mwathae]|uniref:YdbS-like PH domain-containing protein n=1 Tax=Nocardiopsis mwathae TaxID=1472723 RepID=A0A7X0D4S5_9ACTN|nr:PH domain-containing protein [Nocardiopsis mwathae]MBB6171498.1 hypothetical protein [Nocardiopsis mwathae]